MTHEEMLRNIDALRERADISYEEALELLEKNDGDVTRALIELENQGRLHANTSAQDCGSQTTTHAGEAKEKATSFFKKACQTRLVVERKGADGEPETVANLSAPFAVGVTIIAPYVTLASAALGVVSGLHVKVRKEENGTII